MLRLRDIMTTDVVTVSSSLSLQEAMELLTARHFSGAPVIDGGEVVGVISSTDLMSFAASLLRGNRENQNSVTGDIKEQFGLLNDVEDGDDQEDEPSAAFFANLWTDTDADVSEQFQVSTASAGNVLDESSVADAMTTDVCALPPDTPIDRAADLMRSREIHRVLVMSGRHLLGIVTTKDVANAVADNKLTARMHVFGAPTGHSHQ